MIVIFLTAIIAISFAIIETKEFHYSTSIFSLIPKTSRWYRWTYQDSWKNKYKNNDPTQGQKFFGSTTIFVFLTDIYHFFKMIIILSICVGFILPFYLESKFIILNLDWYWNLIILLIIYFTFFELFYSHILR